MALQTGQWDILANGFEGILEIRSVEQDGSLIGTVFGQPIAGTWSEVSQTITFQRIIDPGDLSTTQSYTGYQFFGRGRSWLAGFFIAGPGTGGTPERSHFGWFASI